MISQLWNHYRASYRGLPKTAWLLAFITLVNRSGSMVLFFLALYLTGKLGISVLITGQLVAVYGFGSLVGAYLGGRLSDSIGSGKVQLLSLFLSGIGLIIIMYLESTVLLAIALFLEGLVTDAFRPANSTAMAAICKETNRARGFALQRLAVNLGVAIGPAIGGFLARISYDYLFWVDGLTCILSGILLLFFYQRFDKKSSITHKPDKEQISSPLKDKHLLSILLLLFPLGLVFFQIFNAWPLYLREICKFTEDKIGILLGINAIIITLVEMPLIHYVNRFKPLRIISIGTLLIGLSFMIIPFNTSYLYIIASVILMTFGEMLTFPLTSTYIANRATDHNRGKYMGLYTLTFSLMFMVGPPLGGKVYILWGPQYIWYAAGVFGLLAFSGFRLMNMHHQKTSKQ